MKNLKFKKIEKSTFHYYGIFSIFYIKSIKHTKWFMLRMNSNFISVSNWWDLIPSIKISTVNTILMPQLMDQNFNFLWRLNFMYRVPMGWIDTELFSDRLISLYKVYNHGVKLWGGYVCHFYSGFKIASVRKPEDFWKNTITRNTLY